MSGLILSYGPWDASHSFPIVKNTSKTRAHQRDTRRLFPARRIRMEVQQEIGWAIWLFGSSPFSLANSRKCSHEGQTAQSSAIANRASKRAHFSFFVAFLLSRRKG